MSKNRIEYYRKYRKLNRDKLNEYNKCWMRKDRKLKVCNLTSGRLIRDNSRTY